MPPKDYVWDSQAAQRIHAQELDKLYGSNNAHYKRLAKEAWDSLNRVSGDPGSLKHDDLTGTLFPLIERDSVTLKGMADRKLPDPLGRGGPQWFSWFTHYIGGAIPKGDYFVNTVATTRAEVVREEAERLVDLLRTMNQEAQERGIDAPSEDRYDDLADILAERLQKAA